MLSQQKIDSIEIYDANEIIHPLSSTGGIDVFVSRACVPRRMRCSTACPSYSYGKQAPEYLAASIPVHVTTVYELGLRRISVYPAGLMSLLARCQAFGWAYAVMSIQSHSRLPRPCFACLPARPPPIPRANSDKDTLLVERRSCDASF